MNVRTTTNKKGERTDHPDHVCCGLRTLFLTLASGLFVCYTTAILGQPVDLPKLKIGTLYSKARAGLIMAGNRPAPFVARPAGYCVGSEDVCKAYPEAESCAVDQQRPCIFDWQTKQGTRFVIVTIGEYFADMVVSGVRAQPP